MYASTVRLTLIRWSRTGNTLTLYASTLNCIYCTDCRRILYIFMTCCYPAGLHRCFNRLEYLECGNLRFTKKTCSYYSIGVFVYFNGYCCKQRNIRIVQQIKHWVVWSGLHELQFQWVGAWDYKEPELVVDICVMLKRFADAHLRLPGSLRMSREIACRLPDLLEQGVRRPPGTYQDLDLICSAVDMDSLWKRTQRWYVRHILRLDSVNFNVGNRYVVRTIEALGTKTVVVECIRMLNVLSWY